MRLNYLAKFNLKKLNQYQGCIQALVILYVAFLFQIQVVFDALPTFGVAHFF